jgi:putative membrane protein
VAGAPKLAEADLDSVAAATREAEARCGGEIVSVVVDRCDRYESGLWKAATLGSVFLSLLAAVAHTALGVWGGPPVVWISVPALAGAGAGYLAARVWPFLHRALIGEDVLARRVERRATVAFLQEEVFATRDRRGVLILVALFEHRVEILRDSGVEARVAPAAWQPLVDALVAGLRAGRTSQALVQCVEACGLLLAEHGFEADADEVNELSDRPRRHES